MQFGLDALPPGPASGTLLRGLVGVAVDALLVGTVSGVDALLLEVVSGSLPLGPVFGRPPVAFEFVLLLRLSLNNCPLLLPLTVKCFTSMGSCNTTQTATVLYRA